MAVFRCERFPHGEVPIRTTAGLVWFQDGRADVTDPEVAAALREVPPVFGIVEEGAGEGAGDPPSRPPASAPKVAWVKYAVAVEGMDAFDANAMTKAALMERFS